MRDNVWKGRFESLSYNSGYTILHLLEIDNIRSKVLWCLSGQVRFVKRSGVMRCCVSRQGFVVHVFVRQGND